MAIRRTLAEFSDDIATADIADDAITGGKLANDIAISTTGAITTTGAFTSIGIDDNSNATAITIDSSENIALTGGGNITSAADLSLDVEADITLTALSDIIYQTTSTNSTAGHHIFKSYNSEIMRIDGANNRVGIGTAAPAQSLHIKGSGGQHIYLESDNGDAFVYVDEDGANNCGMIFRESGTEKARLYMEGSGESLRIKTAGTDRMSITSAGNVGIGTTGNSVGGAPGSTDGKFNIYSDAGSSVWAMQIRGDNAAAHGLFIRAGSSGGYYPLYVTTSDENTPLIVCRGDNRIGIGRDDPRVNCDFSDTYSVRMYGAYGANIGGDTYRDLLVRNDGHLGTTSSSERHKKNIEDMGNIDWLYDLRPVEFDWKELNLAGETSHDYGLIAEEVFEIRPALTSTIKDLENPEEEPKLDGVTYTKLIPFLLKAVQDLSIKNDALETQVSTLETQVSTMWAVEQDSSSSNAALEARLIALEAA